MLQKPVVKPFIPVGVAFSVYLVGLSLRPRRNAGLVLKIVWAWIVRDTDSLALHICLDDVAAALTLRVDVAEGGAVRELSELRVLAGVASRRV